MDDRTGIVTGLLRELRDGRREAFDEVLPLVYDELKAIAARHMRRERDGHTLGATAVVNEAYFKLVDQSRIDWQGKTHFLAIASSAMRRLLVDHARAKLRDKRGGVQHRVDLEEALAIDDPDVDAIVAVHEALERLATLDERQARVVEMRYFGGLSVDETAEQLGISRRTVELEWTHAKAWLRRELQSADEPR
ncbi:MAG: sigma-70 family RNA polymerase sigma factor [Blastocatellia bacterium]